MPAALRRIALVLALVAAAGCGWLKPQATPILPAEELYQLGENQLNVKRYPESRYATDSLAKIDICRGRLAQKEVWVAAYYINQGNPSAARQRLELVLKDYVRTLVYPEALWLLAEVNNAEGKPDAAKE